MARKIVILDGHPDRAEPHLIGALANAYKKGAEAAGHEVTSVAVGALEFPLLRSQRSYKEDPTPEVLIPAQKAVLAADHVVILYPLWLGTMPALLKGFFEQIFRPSLMEEPDNLMAWRRLMKGTSARIVITMGMPGFIYRLVFRAHGLKNLERNILGFVGFGPIRSTLFGMVEAASAEKRAGWLKKMERLGREAR